MGQRISQLPTCNVLTVTVYKAKTTTIKRSNTFSVLMAAIGTCRMGAKEKVSRSETTLLRSQIDVNVLHFIENRFTPNNL
ncbi:hypothetical protein DPMN_050354 [Dreissena polymorpha]|uniref:Uncharacterized protein n=1 Tax=Dreissena polymorpha TaxID=45954 RepID=A0A9D4CFZ0_DREPO|nr:hypothetical protein DPMN_050354 [Dreissena polymorpha]